MKAVIAYGTGSGSTAKVAQAVAEGMTAAGIGTASVRIEYITPARLAGADIIGVGAPVHFYREARYVTKFLSTLPQLDGKRGFVFCTCGMDRPGETLRRLYVALAKCGVSVVGGARFQSAMSYLPLRRRRLGNGEELPDESVLAAAREFGARMATADVLPTIAAPPVSRITRLKARMLADMRVRRLIFPAVRLNRAKCTGYGSCLSRCLLNGLERNEGESVPYLADTCVHCLECVSWCPRAAIELDSQLKEWTSTVSYRLGIH